MNEFETSKNAPLSDISSKNLHSGLYIVSTPIGNLHDMTYRAVDILKRVGLILCEDTRQSAKLLTSWGINTPCRSYHDHIENHTRNLFLKQLKQGQSMALISDAGTPLVNDPGYKLVRECLDQDIHVHGVPGVSCVTAALVLSGLPCENFAYYGFVPLKSAMRVEFFKNLKYRRETLIFLESPRRLMDTLEAMKMVFGPQRPASVARELTKKFEEVKRGNLQSLMQYYGQKEKIKGEIVLMVQGERENQDLSQDEMDDILLTLIPKQGLKRAAQILAQLTHQSKRDIYSRALALKKGE